MMPKSLMQFVCEAFDEVIPAGSGVTGAELYVRGFNRWNADCFEREMRVRRRELMKSMPLLSASQTEEGGAGE